MITLLLLYIVAWLSEMISQLPLVHEEDMRMVSKQALAEVEVGNHRLCLTMFHHHQVLMHEGAEVVVGGAHHEPEVQEEDEDVAELRTQKHQSLQLQILNKDVPTVKRSNGKYS